MVCVKFQFTHLKFRMTFGDWKAIALCESSGVYNKKESGNRLGFWNGGLSSTGALLASFAGLHHLQYLITFNTHIWREGMGDLV